MTERHNEKAKRIAKLRRESESEEGGIGKLTCPAPNPFYSALPDTTADSSHIRLPHRSRRRTPRLCFRDNLACLRLYRVQDQRRRRTFMRCHRRSDTARHHDRRVAVDRRRQDTGLASRMRVRDPAGSLRRRRYARRKTRAEASAPEEDGLNIKA